MEISLVQMMVIHYHDDTEKLLSQHLEFCMYLQLINMTIHSYDDQKAKMKELQMSTLRAC